MFTPEELRALADLLENNLTTAALPPERQQELLLRGIVAALEEMGMGDEALSDQALWNQALSDQALREEERGSFLSAQAPKRLLPSSPITLLYHTSAKHPNTNVRSQAFQALARLAQEGKTAAVDALYRLAVEEGLPAARQRIITQGWQPGVPALRALFDWFTSLEKNSPYPEETIPLLTQAYFEEASSELQRRLLATAPQARMENWARIIAAVQGGQEQPLQELVERYPSFRPAERAAALELLDRLASSDRDTQDIAQRSASHPEITQPAAQYARDALAALYIRHEDPAARRLVLSHAYLPEDPEQRALFFFLAEAWPQYETLDFDHHLLVNAYESAGRSLRRRLLEHSRHTGQIEWLRGMGGGAGEVRWLEDLADADWELTIRRLSENEKDADLWRLAQVAPPVWSAAILDRLGKRSWQPANEEERPSYHRLLTLARESLSGPLTIHPLKTLYIPPIADVTCLAINPQGTVLAAGRNDQYILLWDLPSGDLRSTPLIGPAPVTRALTFSPDGEMVVSAAGDNRIRVFGLQNARMLKTFDGHRAMIRGLAVHPDGRTLYSAGFDGSIRFWRFPYGTELTTLHPRTVEHHGPGEIFSLAMSATGSHLITGGADCLVRVWTLPEGLAARAMTGHTDTITYLAASPASELVASAGREGVIRLWNFTSGGLLRTIENDSGPLTALCMHPNDQVLIGGHSKGDITLWSQSTGRVIEQFNAHRQAITGLVLSPEGDTLYSADSSGRLLVWDLRAFLAIRLLDRVSRPGASAALQDRLKEPNLSASEKKWLSFSAELARWRQRFDIELAEVETIQVGEFDIEL